MSSVLREDLSPAMLRGVILGGGLGSPGEALGAVVEDKGQPVTEGVDLDGDGVDSNGVFWAPASQEAAPASVVLALDELDLAEGALRRGEVVALESLDSEHVLFRATLQLHEDDAAMFGVETLSAAFKPCATGTYGTEYRRELAFYKLGRFVEARGLIPIVERDVAYTDELRVSVEGQLSDGQREKLLRFGDASDRLHGSLQLWVEGYADILGTRTSSNTQLSSFSKALVEGGEWPVGNDPMWQSLSDMFVLDFLVGNSDRSQEAGTIRLASGRQALVMLDNGDAFLSRFAADGSERCRLYLENVRVLSPNVYDALGKLDETTVLALLVDDAGEPLVKAEKAKRVWTRAKELRSSYDRLMKKSKAGLFARASRELPLSSL